MRSDFETWINGLTDDDGSGTVGDIPNKAFFNTQMGLIDDAINTTGGLITTDTTYYVATTGSDTTGDGSVTTPWATPAKALSVLGNYRVQEGKTLTIQCEDGTYTFTSPISNLPKGFLLTGKNTHAKTMSSVQSSSGTTGNWSVVINVNNVANVTTSDYALISAASGGTNPKYIEGVWDITAVDAVNNRITVATTHRGASAPASTVAATVVILKTVFSFVGCHGVNLVSQISGEIKNAMIKGDNTASTYGFYLTNASITADTSVGVSNFGGGGVGGGVFVYNRSQLSCNNMFISGNGGMGVQSSQLSAIRGDSAIASGNNGYGVHATNKGIANIRGTITGNALYGAVATRQSVVIIQGATLNANATYDVYAEKYGYIDATSATIAGSTSPAVNTQGNEYGYIDT